VAEPVFPSWPSGLALAGSVPAMAALGARFYRRQKSGALGGVLSKPKAYWLPFAIWFWFIVCPIVALDGVVAAPLRLALGAFGAFMWLRGVVELFMLYVTRNWRPPFGIAHDVLCAALVLGILVAHADALRALERPIDLWALGLCGALLASLAVEVHHAFRFHAAVKGRTTGEGGVWFADAEQEHFRDINRNTFVWNTILSVAVGAFVLRYLTLGFLS
jgi:hypothetical protein